MDKRVLIGCEFSGVVRQAFRKLGFDAWSCDLLPAKDNSPYHYQCDIFELLKKDFKWDLAIFHPPCTYLCNSGVRWLRAQEIKSKIVFNNGNSIIIHKGTDDLLRWKQMREGANFFKKLLDLPISRICIENPIPHKYALDIIGKKYDQNNPTLDVWHN